jgi:tetratricopeptide (TPR) repeat protein
MIMLNKVIKICCLLIFQGFCVSQSVDAQETVIRVVTQNGQSLSLDSFDVNGENIVMKAAVGGFVIGQAIPITFIDRVAGSKPAEINQGIALLLMDDLAGALKLLEPILLSQKVTAKIPGNFWVPTAKAVACIYALNSSTLPKAEALTKEISSVTPESGNDPIGLLVKALSVSISVNIDARNTALNDLVTDSLPTDICAYASFFRGQILRKAKREEEALDAYLQVSCIYPTGSRLITGASELYAAQILNIQLNRRAEVLLLLNNSVRNTEGTKVAEEAKKSLDSTK